MSHFTCKFFKENRNKLAKELGERGIVFVSGNGLIQRSGDTHFPFRQDSSFYYLTGVDEPSAFLVIDLATKNSFISFPIRDGVRAIFDGKQNMEALKLQSGVDEILDSETGWSRLSKLTSKKVFTIIPSINSDNDILLNPFSKICLDKLKNGSFECEDISRKLALLRMVKSPEELSVMLQATTITYRTLNEIENSLDSFSTEKSIEAEITKLFSVYGAAGHAYQPIIASGNNSCILHYIENSQLIKNNSVLLIDVGAEVSNYAADISRTFMIGRISKLEEDIISAVKAVQGEIIKEIKPGVTFKEVALSTHHKIAKQLVSLGMVKKKYSNEDIFNFFPHGVSHFLGLDVHDVGDYETPLQENMTITVEPGIYWKQRGIGVRIEDDVVVTKEGAQIIGDNSFSLL